MQILIICNIFLSIKTRFIIKKTGSLHNKSLIFNLLVDIRKDTFAYVKLNESITRAGFAIYVLSILDVRDNNYVDIYLINFHNYRVLITAIFCINFLKR